MPLKWRARQALHHLTQIRGQFVAQPMVNVQLRLTALGEVHRVDRVRLLDERFVVLLHRLLPRCVRLSAHKVTSFWCRSLEGRTARTRGDVKLALEILHLQPERQVLFAEVIPEEFTKQVTERRIVDNEL
jgi:DNA-binding GntR family transcriptional regulator